MPLGPHPSEMPEWNAAWVLYQAGTYDGYVPNFKMACEKWEASARLIGLKPPQLFTMAKVASAMATPKALREMHSAATTRKAQMKVVGETKKTQRRNSEYNDKTLHMGNGPRAGSDPDVRCGTENFEFINESQKCKAENGQAEIAQQRPIAEEVFLEAVVIELNPNI